MNARNHLRLFGLLAAALLLAGCEIVFTIEPLPPGISITRAVYSSEYGGESYQNTLGEPVICDNLTMTLVYSFDYAGSLESWTSFLQGVTTGVVTNRETFYPDSGGVTFGAGRVTVRQRIPPGSAPLGLDPTLVPGDAATDVEATVAASDDALGTRTIIVTPTDPAYSRLYLQINGWDGSYRFSGRIQVVPGC